MDLNNDHNEPNDGRLSGPAIGGRLLLLRGRKGWSRPVLAEKAGVAAATIKKLENRQTQQPESETVAALAAALGVPYRRLAYGEGGGVGSKNGQNSEGNDFVTQPGSPLTRTLGIVDAPPSEPDQEPSDQPGMRVISVTMLPFALVARANAGPGGGTTTPGESVDLPSFALGEGQDRRELREVAAVQVVGDCMAPHAPAGVYVLIEQRDPRPGDRVVVEVRDTEEVIYKYWYPLPGERVALEPHRDSGVGRRQEFALADVRVIGVEFGVVRLGGGLARLRSGMEGVGMMASVSAAPHTNVG